jgi:hypothetical protein
VKRALLRALPLLASGCAIAPRPPSPDPIQGGVRAEGKLEGAAPAQAAFCVSQDVPESLVQLIQDGAAVRPAPGVGRPDYALMLTQQEQPGTVAWKLLVAEPGEAAAARATQLRGALANCLGLLGRPT